jgi:hypothetical protein
MSGGACLDKLWWEAFAAELIPDMQKAIIDALGAAGKPLTKGELAEAIGADRPKLVQRIDYHLHRLRTLDAVDIEVSGTGPNRTKYRLTERPGRGLR